MTIGIDARFVGPEGTGLGKYTEKLILNLAKIDSRNQYFIYLRKNNWDYLNLNSNFKKVLADVPWYSLAEQIKMPLIFRSSELDLLHVPHFNAPIFYRGKFIVTIHDLIHHHFKEQSATTKSQAIFRLKRFGYKIIIDNAVKRSQMIIAPSKFVKDEIIRSFRVDPKKIIVTYEAAEEEYFITKRSFLKEMQKSKIKNQNYLIYVGNIYPHKNISRLLDALKILTTNYGLRTMNLVIVCPRDVFQKRLLEEIKRRGLKDKVEVKDYQEPASLVRLFSYAKAYIFPSLSEGFGIPGLNAMAANLPVVSSSIPVLKEIYGDAALYFNPDDPKDIASKIKNVLTGEKLRADLIEKGKAQAKKYSWQKMAKETLKIYEEVR